MVKVLQVFPQMNNAGTEKVIMNLYNNIDKSKVITEFLAQQEGELDETIKLSGGKIHYISKTTKQEYLQVLENFFRENDFTAVHVHLHKDMGLVLKAAKKAGIKHRIAHSHNSRPDLPQIAKLYKLITGIDTIRNANHLFACSKLAAQWVFPTRWRECKTIYNAIDIEKFQFNESRRNEKRMELGFLPTDKVVCHVGRFSRQKNHKRIIEILNKMTEKDSDLKAILIGNGPLFSIIKSKTKNKNIKFLGSRTDVHELLNAADVFLMPSFHEGLPVVLVEAQVNGLPCIASDVISAETDIGSNLLNFVSLKKSDDEWIGCIEKAFCEYDRKAKSRLAYESNFNIKKVGKEAEDFYLSLGV